MAAEVGPSEPSERLRATRGATEAARARPDRSQGALRAAPSAKSRSRGPLEALEERFGTILARFWEENRTRNARAAESFAHRVSRSFSVVVSSIWRAALAKSLLRDHSESLVFYHTKRVFAMFVPVRCAASFARSLRSNRIPFLVGKSNENRPENCFERVFLTTKRFFAPRGDLGSILLASGSRLGLPGDLFDPLGRPWGSPGRSPGAPGGLRALPGRLLGRSLALLGGAWGGRGVPGRSRRRFGVDFDANLVDIRIDFSRLGGTMFVDFSDRMCMRSCVRLGARRAECSARGDAM